MKKQKRSITNLEIENIILHDRIKDLYQTIEEINFEIKLYKLEIAFWKDKYQEEYIKQFLK